MNDPTTLTHPIPAAPTAEDQLPIVEPQRLRRHLAQAAAGIPMSLATIEQALGAEAWLHALDRNPGPSWTRAHGDGGGRG